MEKHVRICYENGNSKTGKKIYEMHKICKCSYCQYRNRIESGSWNCATATTQDENKIEEVFQFLEKWTCGNKERQKTVYFKF